MSILLSYPSHLTWALFSCRIIIENQISGYLKAPELSSGAITHCLLQALEGTFCFQGLELTTRILQLILTTTTTKSCPNLNGSSLH